MVAPTKMVASGCQIIELCRICSAVEELHPPVQVHGQAPAPVTGMTVARSRTSSAEGQQFVQTCSSYCQSLICQGMVTFTSPPCSMWTRKLCARCYHRPSRRTLCLGCNRRVGPCCWNDDTNTCLDCDQAEPDPEPGNVTVIREQVVMFHRTIWSTSSRPPRRSSLCALPWCRQTVDGMCLRCFRRFCGNHVYWEYHGCCNPPSHQSGHVLKGTVSPKRTPRPSLLCALPWCDMVFGYECLRCRLCFCDNHAHWEYHGCTSPPPQRDSLPQLMLSEGHVSSFPRPPITLPRCTYMCAICGIRQCGYCEGHAGMCDCYSCVDSIDLCARSESLIMAQDGPSDVKQEMRTLPRPPKPRPQCPQACSHCAVNRCALVQGHMHWLAHDCSLCDLMWDIFDVVSPNVRNRTCLCASAGM